MRNIQPWCISRQLWWGASDPGVGTGPTARRSLPEDEAGANALAKQHYKKMTVLKRDEDVASTPWFSSALWAFSTLGWPDKTPELGRLLSHERAGHWLRHHLLSGSPA